MQIKSNYRKKTQKKGNHKCTKIAHAKTQCKTNRNQKIYIIYCKFKNANAENAFGHLHDSYLGGVHDMQSRLSRFHAFRLLNLPHMQYVQE